MAMDDVRFPSKLLAQLQSRLTKDGETFEVVNVWLEACVSIDSNPFVELWVAHEIVGGAVHGLAAYLDFFLGCQHWDVQCAYMFA